MNKNVRIAKELVRLAKSLVAQNNEDEAIEDAVNVINNEIKSSVVASKNKTAAVSKKILNTLLVLALTFGCAACNKAIEKSDLDNQSKKAVSQQVVQSVNNSIKSEQWNWKDKIEAVNSGSIVKRQAEKTIDGVTYILTTRYPCEFVSNDEEALYDVAVVSHDGHERISLPENQSSVDVRSTDITTEEEGVVGPALSQSKLKQIEQGADLVIDYFINNSN